VSAELCECVYMRETAHISHNSALTQVAKARMHTCHTLQHTATHCNTLCECVYMRETARIDNQNDSDRESAKLCMCVYERESEKER